MRVLIAGNITWTDEGGQIEPIYNLIQYYKDECEFAEEWTPLVVISGMAPGVDWFAYEGCKKLGVYCDEYPWNEWGQLKALTINPKAKKQSRNQWMLNSGVDVCHGYTRPLTTASGTRDMMSRCFLAGVKTYWHDFDDNIFELTADPGYKNQANFDPERDLSLVLEAGLA